METEVEYFAELVLFNRWMIFIDSVFLAYALLSAYLDWG